MTILGRYGLLKTGLGSGRSLIATPGKRLIQSPRKTDAESRCVMRARGREEKSKLLCDVVPFTRNACRTKNRCSRANDVTWTRQYAVTQREKALDFMAFRPPADFARV